MSERRDDETIADRPELDETRREALAKMGRLAGYTAPVMLGLLGATKARAQAKGSPKKPSLKVEADRGSHPSAGCRSVGLNSSAPGRNWSGQRVA